MGRYRKPILSLLLVLATVTLVSLTARERERVSWLEQQAVELLAPVQAAFSQTAQRVREAAAGLSELAEVRVENVALRDQLRRLPWLEQELLELRAENERLRQLVGFSQAQPFSFTAARLIARNPDNWFSYAVMDKGSRDGIARDMPVVTHGGLVGRVVRVSPRTSTVLFLVDRDSGVAARVYRPGDQKTLTETESYGVVLGQGAQQPVLHLRIFSHEARVEPGDRVVTSGLGGVFPPGLAVGEVLAVTGDELGLSKTATVAPAVDFHRLLEVLIITDPRPEEIP